MKFHHQKQFSYFIFQSSVFLASSVICYENKNSSLRAWLCFVKEFHVLTSSFGPLPPRILCSLGTANIGKSTLFTTLLNSDFSKTKASYLIKQPTISRWPGTTLNLLKFPILRPTKDKVMVRNARLKAEKDDIAQTRPLKAHERQSTVKLSAYWEGTVECRED